MVNVVPIRIDDWTAIGVEVQLPKTTLLAISAGPGYIMCGALDVRLLNEKLGERKIVAGRAVGVRTLQQLLDAPLEAVTDSAKALGIDVGMSGKDAVRILARTAS
ncbi:YunC family protein [Paenibacillaceae bacterium WGS1546]|uniref:YunC family protein n=1 Tax=Cohnella sp. WGS1546 TaxID=3366810 RepID=UPI00372D2B75